MNERVLQWGVAGLGVITLGLALWFFISGDGDDAINAASTTPPAANTAASPVTTQAGGDVGGARIAVINREAIMGLSAAGKSMIEQAQALARSSENEFKAAADQLGKDNAEMERESAILSAAVRQQRQREITNRQNALQKRMQDREQEIQGGLAQAGQKLDEALGPILDEVMKERGATILLERNSVLLATVDIDISAQVVERLDKVLPTVKVNLVKPTAATAQGAAPAPAPAPAAGTP